MEIHSSLTKILQPTIAGCLEKVKVTVNEIRLRAGREIMVRSGLNCYFVNAAGVCVRGKGYTVGEKELEDIVFNACGRSVYAFQEEISRGSVTLAGGVRVGLCGAAVLEGDKIIAQRNITGVNIRIPFEVNGCAAEIVKSFKGRAQSALIAAPVYSGKTTVLRDLAANIHSYFGVYNALLIDERNEISGTREGRAAFNLPFVDVLVNCPKTSAVENIIRSMAPEVIIMDEFFEREMDVVKTAANCGILIFASAHAGSIGEVINRFGKENLKAVFSRYFILSNTDRIGRLVEVYDENFNRV